MCVYTRAHIATLKTKCNTPATANTQPDTTANHEAPPGVLGIHRIPASRVSKVGPRADVQSKLRERLRQEDRKLKMCLGSDLVSRLERPQWHMPFFNPSI